jgi:benzoate membrane transport protein
MGEAIGAFMLSGGVIFLIGASGWFERIMRLMPMSLASALLAGVLAGFCLTGFAAAQNDLGLVLVMLAAYLLGRRLFPLYAVADLPGSGGGRHGAEPRIYGAQPIPAGLTVPVFVAPVFSLVRSGQSGFAAVHRDHGLAEHARRSGHQGLRVWR